MSSRVTKIDKPPMLPPKKIAPDPDYEVIEFSNEQYSNAQPIIAPSAKSLEGIKCELCGSMTAKVKCDHCNQQLFCSSCDDMFHRHPKRNTHIRKAIVIQPDIKPPLPPKGDALLPVPPPRRKKTGFTPMLPRKDFTLPRPVAPPSPALSLRERVSSIKRLITPNNKSTPETPNKKEVQQIISSRPGTPNSDTSAKLPSLAMERIKIHTNNARDRMEIMQKRYHEYQDSLKSDSQSIGSNRASMNASPFERINIDNRNSTNRSNSFGTRLRSGSLSNFASHFKNGNARYNQNFNDFDDIATQDEGTLSDSRSRAFSSSVQDLNGGRNNTNWQMPPQQFAPPFGYMPNQPYHYHNQMQHGSCMNCSQQQLWNPHNMPAAGAAGDPQWNAKNLNGSNMSLNLPPFYPQPFDINGTTWVNNGTYRKPDGYPYHFGMIPNAYPFPVSRPQSRSASRAVSPALSSKSRKSTMSSRNLAAFRHSYIDQRLSDDDSSESITSYMDDVDTRRKGDRRDSAGRSIRSSRQSLSKSSPQRSFDEDSETFSRRGCRHSARERRASSSARSVTSRTERRPSSRVRSDSTQDSEAEFGTKALVQAKIREKVAQASSSPLDESSSDLFKPKGTMPPKIGKPTVLETKIKPKTLTAKTEKDTKTPTKTTVRKKSVEKIKTNVAVGMKPTKKTEAASAPAPKPAPKQEPVTELPAQESGSSEIDLNNVPDTVSEGPPKTPDYEWTCEHCTFVNEPNVKICAICCKTPSANAVRKPDSPEKDKKTTINGKVPESAEISKEGFWLVPTSEDEKQSELESYESNDAESVVDSDAERSDNDFEVMEILGQIEPTQQKTQNEIKLAENRPEENNISDVKDEDVERSDSRSSHKDNEMKPPSPSFDETFVEDTLIAHTDDVPIENTLTTHSTHITNEHKDTLQTSEQNVQANTSVQQASAFDQPPPPMHSTQGLQDEPPPIQSANINQRSSLDSDILAYIDQSLKTLIGANQNNNNNNHIPNHVQSTPLLPMAPPPFTAMQLYSATTANQPNRRLKNDVDLYKVLLGANNYTFEEIQVALANCPDGDPLTWLSENWTKLIETVQTLATKYGQEHKENIVGTISAVEARDVLIKNKGNVWHAVTQCIEQRQQAFNTIKSLGNYSREDIVSSLTAHNGDIELTISELNRLHLKPFLLKIQNSPPRVESELVNVVQSQEPVPSTSNQTSAAETEVQENQEKPSTENVSALNDDKNILKDIEVIISSMEEKQSKQTEALLSTIENLVGNMILSQNSRSMSSASSFSGLDRIDVKSPLPIPSKIASEIDQSTDVETNVKNFVSRHIQDVVPDVAAMISKELVESQQSQNAIDKSMELPLEVENNVEREPVAATRVPNNESVLVEKAIANVHAAPVAENEQLSASLNQQLDANKHNSVETFGAQALKTPNNVNQNDLPSTSSSIEQISVSSADANVQQTSWVNRPRYVVGKSNVRYSQKQMDKRRIRELEKQLRRQQRTQRSRRSSFSTDRSESQNTGYFSDSTVIADDEDVENVAAPAVVSNEKTFSLSIVGQAVSVDDNKEQNLTISPPNLQNHNDPSSSQKSAEPIASVAATENPTDSINLNETVKDAKNRNLSELVEHTKSLIQQMKNEIDEDIAMSEDFNDDDNGGYLSDEMLYSDEIEEGEEEGEFSDSWEDISGDESIIISGDEEIDEHFGNEDNLDYYVDIRRSSQSVDSEFFVEARESLTSENELSNTHNSSIQDNLHEHLLSADDIYENRQEPIQSEIIDVESGPSATLNDDRLQENNQNVIQNTSETPLSNETAISVDDSITPATDNLMEHILEIQQSLQTSSIISVSFRETSLREKSQSVEPSDSASSNIHSPDQYDQVLQSISEPSADQQEIDLISVGGVGSGEQLKIPTIHIESIESASVFDTVVSESNIEESQPEVESQVAMAAGVSEQNVDENEHKTIANENIVQNASASNSVESTSVENVLIEGQNGTNDAVTQKQVDDEEGVADEDDGEEEEEETDDDEDAEEEEEEEEEEEALEEDNDQHESNLASTSGALQQNDNDHIIHTATVQQENLDENTAVSADIVADSANKESILSRGNSTESSASENQNSHPIDTESEMEELSVDVSTSDSSIGIEMVKTTVTKSTIKPIGGTIQRTATVANVTSPTSNNAKGSQLKKSNSVSTVNPVSKTTVKNKIPVRRPSFNEPSPSIRNIQNELMNKQMKQPPKFVSKKPSKIVPPKLFFKSNLAQEPSTSGASSTSKSVKSDHSKPSTSSGKTSIPKKKYYETCFSDDNYQTSDDEKPITSQKVIPNLVKIIETNVEESIDTETLAHKLAEAGKVRNYAEALMAAELMQEKFREDISIWAATECSTIEQAKRLLQQECELCTETYPVNQIVSMLKCTHSCCENCARNYFTIQITDRSITDCSCPFCKLPDLNASETTEDDALEYFSNLDILLKNILEVSVHELFQRKLRDRTLMQDPNFKWCVQCSSGFFARPRQKRLICPDCGSVTCAQCRKVWEVQHEGITCDQFSDWKELNDPDKQMEEVSKHLQLHGIACPKCKFKYSLARGGCMHFTCTQCKYEFCYGCNKPFKMGAQCGLSDYCAKLGLHSHHPRNCLFYLRDKEPRELQTLLKMHNIPFSTEPGSTNLGLNDGAKTTKYCPIPIQKETPSGLVDTVCNGDIEESGAGLCRPHFVEYLVSVVCKAKIDPLPILDLTDCVQELRRRGLALPDRGPWDTDPIYRDMCSKIVEKHIPLD